MSGGRRRVWAALLVHAVLLQAVAFSLRPAATYRGIEQGLPPTLLGLLSAAYAFAPLVCAVPVGRLVDRVGERGPLLLGGAALTAAAAVLWLGPQGPWWLLGVLAVFGVAHLTCVVGEQSIVGGLRGDSTSRFSHYTLASSLGQAAGPLLLTVGGSNALPDLDVVLAVTTGLAGCATAMAGVLGTRRGGGAARHRRSGTALLRDRGLRNAVVVSGVVMAALDILLVYLPALATERGLPAGLVGAVLSARALASMGARLLTAPVVRRIGRRATLAGGCGLAIAGVVLMVAVDEVPALAAGAVVVGAGLGVAQPLTMAIVSDLAPVDSRALAMSLRISGNRLGVLLLPAGTGLVFGGLGPAGVLAASAGALAGALALSLRGAR